MAGFVATTANQILVWLAEDTQFCELKHMFKQEHLLSEENKAKLRDIENIFGITRRISKDCALQNYQRIMTMINENIQHLLTTVRNQVITEKQVSQWQQALDNINNLQVCIFFFRQLKFI